MVIMIRKLIAEFFICVSVNRWLTNNTNLTTLFDQKLTIDDRQEIYQTYKLKVSKIRRQMRKICIYFIKKYEKQSTNKSFEKVRLIGKRRWLHTHNCQTNIETPRWWFRCCCSPPHFYSSLLLIWNKRRRFPTRSQFISFFTTRK